MTRRLIILPLLAVGALLLPAAPAAAHHKCGHQAGLCPPVPPPIPPEAPAPGVPVPTPTPTPGSPSPSPTPAPTPAPAPSPSPAPTAQPTRSGAFEGIGTTPVPVPSPAAPPTASPPAAGVGFQLLDPFPIVRIRGTALPGGARVQLLAVRARRGARISVRCAGPCPKRRLARATRGRVRLRPYERFLRAGVRLTIRVSDSGRIGKYTRIRIRSGLAPLRTDSCVESTRLRPVACPTS